MARRGRIGWLLLVLALALASPPAARAGGEEGGQEEKPPSAAERIAGRWRITLDGLTADHEEILASLAVDGDMLIGTLTVGRESVNIKSGKVVGVDLSFSFDHGHGETFFMRGTVGPRGLEGGWEARSERGKWRGSRVN